MVLYPPPPMHSKCPCIVSGGARQPSLSVLQIYSERRILSLSCAFAGWTRWYCLCIAVYFRFLASKALHCTLYHAEHLSFSQCQPWMLIILTRTPPSAPNQSERRLTGKKVQLRLDAFLRPPSPPPADETAAVQLTGETSPRGWSPLPGPLPKPAPRPAKPRAKLSTKSATKPAAQVAAKPAAGEPVPVARVEQVAHGASF